MTSLIQLRDTLAILGCAQATQLSRQLNLPLARIEGMLERLTAMGKVERIEQNLSGCFSGSCKNCSENQRCHTYIYRLTD